MSKIAYTKAEDDFLRQHYNYYSWEKLTEMLNKQFGTNRKYRAVKTHCNRTLQLIKTMPQDYYRDTSRYAIGDERIENGYVLVKVSDIKGSRQKRNAAINWVPKQRLIWEQHYGKIPEGHQVIFLDGDKSNFDIDNLCCVSLYTMSALNRNQWLNGNKELTLTAIKWVELNSLLNK